MYLIYKLKSSLTPVYCNIKSINLDDVGSLNIHYVDSETTNTILSESLDWWHLYWNSD